MTRKLSDLPDRIVQTLRQADLASSFLSAVKTTVKPNDTIPTLWLVSTESCLLLCSTHRTRGIFRRYQWKVLNSVRKDGAQGSTVIEIIHNDLELPNERYPIDLTIQQEDVHTFVADCVVRLGVQH